ncbi:MAG: DUF3575 domain-containing protein [Alkalispirochaeta sp.]
MKKVFVFVVLAAVVVGTGFAQEEESEKEYSMAAQLSPVGFLFGTYSGNFQYQVAPHHGLMAEIGFGGTSNEFDGVTASQSRFDLGAHYRYHFNPQMDSFFLGPFVKFMSLSGDITTETEDFYTGETDEETFSWDVNTVAVGASIGRRWIWTEGLSIVFRIGYGATSVNVNAGDAADADVELLEQFLGVALGFDGELSIGWAF